ncbi:Retrovirus-related Pol polyprotein from transposon opus [Araneus ventricosus]|uniref:RNA-directed DNA polymerase n=1 Tax=Araneus ventricosus TaxID=182803 RepID=A0A4Y2D048_ARAVE|nr:Retrovirus-related Pol polyprotein from transposon opus [Araneus ventricosus]
MRKTRERIKLSFYWPNVSKDVENYCRTCEKCQLKSPERQSDKIPITPVVRAPYPFHTVNVDLVGEIVPPSGRRHKYCLCLIDQNSRWPEVVPLKNLSAKTTCDALLEIFMRTGIPEIICTDQGTNFTSQLTKEFEDRLGVSPRFSTPSYPASNGLVEKWNRVFKQMLHHVIRSDPTDWDKHIPYLLFAYREVPNCTTGISPFRLMYGREARGPLSVLKSSWSGEIPLPLNLSNSAVDYLQELKINLERAADLASLTTAKKQNSYAHYFNRGKRMREFKKGELVYLLIPDSTNKLYARWTGPGEIIDRINPHSYKVKLPDGNVRHIHANKIRQFRTRAQTVGVIFEDDVEFGEIHPTPVKTSISNYNIEVDVSHLEEHKQLELLEHLHNHAPLFSGKLQVANVGEHKIRLIPGTERKKPYIYKIPESLKLEVDNQIAELESLGLIEPSEAEIAYPIVCVAKKDGSMRLCVDFRLLNAVTKPFDYPMENITELINQIEHANVITCLDVLKGYWEIPLEEESRDFTSFKTHRAQYRWKVMTFGLRNAAASFQKVMNSALSEYREFCKAYLDDIAIFSCDWDTHLKHLDVVLSKLTELKFTVNVKKCVFAKTQLKYLGHIIGAGRHEPDPEKLRAIEIIERPRTKSALKSALGLFNYYRNYIKNYAEIAKPLTDLTKKIVPESIPWTDVEELSFQELKNLLCEAPTLYTPDPKKSYVIQCDASSYGVGACLSQRDDKGNLYPISFASQKFNKVQQNWATIEREAYAVVWSIKKFENYVFGANIEIITDHNPLTFLQKSAPQSAKLQRWALALQRYNIHISHCPGAQLKNADGLSRLVCD